MKKVVLIVVVLLLCCCVSTIGLFAAFGHLQLNGNCVYKGPFADKTCGGLLSIDSSTSSSSSSSKSISSESSSSQKSSSSSSITSKMSLSGLFSKEFDNLCTLINDNDYQTAYYNSDVDFQDQFSYDDFVSKIADPLVGCTEFVPNVPEESKVVTLSSTEMQIYVLGKVNFKDGSSTNVRLSYTNRDGVYSFIGLTAKSTLDDLQ